MTPNFSRSSNGSKPVSALVLVSISALTLAACAGASSGASSGAQAATVEKPVAASSRYVLAQADLEKVQADNAYDAISKLRPEFLRGRSENTSFIQQQVKGNSKDPGGASVTNSSTSGTATVATPVPVMVYKDNARLAGVDDLRQVPLSTIREIRFLQGPEAVIRFGTNHSAGAILVTSR